MATARGGNQRLNRENGVGVGSSGSAKKRFRSKEHRHDHESGTVGARHEP